MGDQERSFVNELIQTSEKLSATNLLKIEYENMLKELNIFRTFTKLWESRLSAASNNKKISPLFKISAHVASSAGENEDENIILTVENTSDFDYNSTYWQFLIENEKEIGVSKTVLCKFKDSSTIFKRENVEKFSFPFVFNSQLPSSERTHFKCYLVFSLKWEGSDFIQQFLIETITIDILYFLSLTRRPIPIDNCLTQLFSTLEVAEDQDKSNDVNLTPPAEFKLCFTNNSQIVSNFIPFLLQDSNFTTTSFTFSEENDKYTVFYYSFMIEIVRNSDFEIGIQCKEPKILIDIKLAILSRLLNSNYHNYKVYVNPPDSEHCENLQELRIELDSLLTKSDTDAGDFVQIYLLLRKCSENIKFIVTNTSN